MSNLDEAVAQMDERLGMAPEEDTPEEPEQVVEVPEAPEEAPVEETPEEPTEETAEEAVERIYAGKYKSPEELEKAYTELQSQWGDQGRELGELRKLVEERLPEQEEQSFQFNQQEVNWFDEQIDENPQAAAFWALQNDPSRTLYNRAMDAWYEMPGQARRAMAFERALEQDQIDQKIAEQTKPLQKQARQQTFATAWAQASSEIPDLVDHAEAILAEAKESPEILRGIETAEDQAKAIQKLYRLVKGGLATSVEVATAESATEQAEAARSAKLSGTAPSQTTTRTPETIDPDEQWADDLLGPYLAPEDE